MGLTIIMNNRNTKKGIKNELKLSKDTLEPRSTKNINKKKSLRVFKREAISCP